jgi:hypothetical protein
VEVGDTAGAGQAQFGIKDRGPPQRPVERPPDPASGPSTPSPAGCRAELCSLPWSAARVGASARVVEWLGQSGKMLRDEIIRAQTRRTATGKSMCGSKSTRPTGPSTSAARISASGSAPRRGPRPPPHTTSTSPTSGAGPIVCELYCHPCLRSRAPVRPRIRHRHVRFIPGNMGSWPGSAPS